MVSPIILNLKGEEMPEEMPTLAISEGAEMVFSPVPVRTLPTTLEAGNLVSPMILGLNLRGEEMVVSPPPVRNLVTALKVTYLVSPMKLNLKGEGMPSRRTALEGAEMVASPLPTLVEVVSPSPMALNLKAEEIPTHATMLEG